MVLGDEEPGPEITIQGILDILRSATQGLNADHAGNSRELVRQLTDTVTVCRRLNVARGYEDDPWRFGEYPEDLVVGPDLRIVL